MSAPQVMGPEEVGFHQRERDRRREIFGWMMYAWAFHGFVTTVATGLFGPYLTDLAQQAVGENGRVFAFDFLSPVTAKSFFFLCVSLSVLLQAFLLPVLGAIADYSHAKKRLLVLTGYSGAGATCPLFFVGAGLDFRWGGLLFIVANLSLGATTVLYNAFLPEIVPPDQRDRVSSRGYALGYLGGGLLLAANLVFMHFAQDLGVPMGRAVRLCLFSAGLWWVGFSLMTFRRLRAREAAKTRPKGRSYLAVGLSELRGTFRELSRLPRTRSYLIAYLFFNDGIQTVIPVASVFFAQELFVARGREVDEAFLLGLILMVQFVGFGGALLFERIAIVTGAKNALLFSLAIWSGVVVYAYWVFQTEAQAWGMAAVIAVVLGGSQALSRSLFSCMIPPHREASFFGIYEIANSGTAWMGPLIFGLVVAATNSYRQAVLSLIALFAAGSILLILTDTRRAIREAVDPAREVGAFGPRGEEMEGPAPPAFAGPPRRLRRVMDEGVACLARLMLHVFFREVEVSGRERIPRGVPLLFVANHNNSVVDSVLLLALPGARPRMLAKSTLFSHPVMGPLLALAGALPVYRSQDAGADVSRNFGTFAHCRRVLAAGGQIALFPEGTSHNERRLPIKSGAARIVLEAEALQGPVGTKIVPVGLNYEAKDRFRSKVWMCVGDAVDPAVEIIRHREDPRAAVRALTARIAVALEEVTPGLEGFLVAAPELRERGHLTWRRLSRSVLAPPIFLLGCALNWIPYRIPGWISDGLSTTPDEPATYKLLAGLLAFPLAWGTEAAIAAQLAGPAWGLAMAVVAPASGYAALRLHEQWTPWAPGRSKDPPAPTKAQQ